MFKNGIGVLRAREGKENALVSRPARLYTHILGILETMPKN